jgi:hypothetical protein
MVKEVGGSANYPILTKTNYSDWSLLMRVMLQARGLWEAVETGDVDFQEDRMALEAILKAVPADLLPVLAVKETAKDAWDAIKTMRVGVDRVRKSKAQELRKQFDAIAFKEGESVEEFSVRLSRLVNNLAVLGIQLEESKVCEKFLHVVPDHLEQIALSIETLLDLDTLSLEELTGRLRNAEERRPKKKSGDEGGKLYLTEEQWAARAKERQSGEGSSGKKAGNNRRRRGGRKKSEAAADGEHGARDTRDQGRDKCKNCGHLGHWAKDCRQPKKQVAAHIAHGEEEDDEPALLMAHAIELAPPPSPSPPPAGLLDLDEPKVFAHLHREEHVDAGVWHLDTGATNHMPSVRDIFAELDTAVRGKVRFGNGSVVAIEGQGKIIFECRNGEHRALTGVYYIPKLNANLVSLGQLDENGCDVRIFHGVCTIRDTARQLLARVRRTRNRLYLIKITVARPMCLSARTQEAAWLWHARFGHLHFDALRRLARRDMVRGLPQIDQVEQLCDCCVITKQRRSPFPGRSLFRAEDRLELVHGDLCGPISPATPGGKKHFLLLVDDASRYMWLALLQNKGEAATAIKRFQARSEAESGCRLKLLRTDNGGEFTSTEFAAHCAESGVKRQLTAP